MITGGGSHMGKNMACTSGLQSESETAVLSSENKQVSCLNGVIRFSFMRLYNETPVLGSFYDLWV